jgi:hypothetical protein
MKGLPPMLDHLFGKNTGKEAALTFPFSTAQLWRRVISLEAAPDSFAVLNTLSLFCK